MSPPYVESDAYELEEMQAKFQDSPINWNLINRN